MKISPAVLRSAAANQVSRFQAIPLHRAPGSDCPRAPRAARQQAGPGQQAAYSSSRPCEGGAEASPWPWGAAREASSAQVRTCRAPARAKEGGVTVSAVGIAPPLPVSPARPISARLRKPRRRSSHAYFRLLKKRAVPWPVLFVLVCQSGPIPMAHVPPDTATSGQESGQQRLTTRYQQQVGGQQRRDRSSSPSPRE